ncbi:glycosyltransferase family 2 protein [Metabacillus litoralis]|uniref:glycosyltransferase family 2 protein n=1 Tax=Metabacillus litoralis TaxID=152268 RepID=UPI00203FC0B6|nr:glycosyltransferase [Metabacillus litoralis]
MKISLAMIVRNEEKNIVRCLNSVKDLVDEIVVVDTGSIDSTLQLLNDFEGVKVYKFTWCDDFSVARNFSLEQTQGDYILVLDADEYVNNGTRKELETISSQGLIGKIQVNSMFEQNNIVQESKAYVSRFFPREVRYTGAIHEQLNSSLKRIPMKLTVKHNGYLNTDKSTRNIPLIINLLKQKPNDSYYLYQLGKELRIKKQYEEAFKFLIRSYELSNCIEPYYEELIVEIIYSGKECGKEEVLDIIEQNEGILLNNTDFHFAKGLLYLEYCISFPKLAGKYIKVIEDSFLTCLKLGKKMHTEYVIGTGSYLASYNLGVYYEVTGQLEKAVKYYEMSSQFGYSLGNLRLQEIIELNQN